MQYKRILLKLSGEALMGDGEYGIDAKVLSNYAQEINAIVKVVLKEFHAVPVHKIPLSFTQSMLNASM